MANDGKLPWEVGHMCTFFLGREGVCIGTVIDRCLNSKYRLVRELDAYIR